MKQLQIQIGDDQALNVKIQNHAISLGWSWEILFNKPMYTLATKLYFTSNGFIYRTLHGVKKMGRFDIITPTEFLKLNRCDVQNCECPSHTGEKA